ncbi:MAG: DoxX family membrane protein [Candidatus Omnitrophica bacterium]|nr:DoxX family membrane protein [Candidatus Omnitrophota bacterium]
MSINVFLILRIILGGIFIVSGVEKAASPVENFIYVLQAYKIVPSGSEAFIAAAFPWFELLTGIFMITGLWLVWVLRASMLLNGALMIVVGQAIIRKLPINDCGCFGNLVHWPLQGVFFLDLAMFLTAFLCLKNRTKASAWSLDMLYGKN